MFTPELALTCKDKCAISHVSSEQLVQVKTFQAYCRQQKIAGGRKIIRPTNHS